MQPAGQLKKKAILKKLLLGAVLLLAMALGTPATAADQPTPLTITEDLSCGVCGMHPAKFGKWQTQIIFTDGAMVPFDGGKDMFRFIFEMAKYEPKHTRADIAAIWVRDFAGGAWLDGGKAIYVLASKVMGPMGKELIPFADNDAAGEFKKANGGTSKPFAAITLADIDQLDMGGMMKKGKM